VNRRGAKRFVTVPDPDGACVTADSTPPRHKRQLPSERSRSWSCEVDACSSVQPSRQQMPSIAFRAANTTSIAAATSLRTHRLSSLPAPYRVGNRARCGPAPARGDFSRPGRRLRSDASANRPSGIARSCAGHTLRDTRPSGASVVATTRLALRRSPAHRRCAVRRATWREAIWPSCGFSGS
jgi:hypothetical protein